MNFKKDKKLLKICVALFIFLILASIIIYKMTGKYGGDMYEEYPTGVPVDWITVFRHIPQIILISLIIVIVGFFLERVIKNKMKD